MNKTLWIVGLIPLLAFLLSPAAAKSQQVSAAGQTVADALPDQALPPGFQAYSNPRGSGRLLYTKISGNMNSARAVMRDSLATLKGYFDGPPQLLAGVSDPQDQAIRVMISANLRGHQVRGVATAVIAESSATFGVVFDRLDSL